MTLNIPNLFSAMQKKKKSSSKKKNLQKKKKHDIALQQLAVTVLRHVRPFEAVVAELFSFVAVMLQLS